jgi:hypothetical protein
MSVEQELIDRVPLMLSAIEQDLGDLVRSGRMGDAVRLREASGQHFNATHRPQYFTGDLSASFVLVHLNPKQPNDLDDSDVDDLPFGGVEQYLAWYSEFGARHYGPSSPQSHRAPFDAKQIRFIRPFGDIEFVEEAQPEDRFTNLERVIDWKLQLEVIPYGSDTFSVGPFFRHPDLLAPHMDRLLQTITAWPRSHVIFCGTVFDRMLARFKTGPTEQFTLVKNDGTPARGTYRFAPLTLEYEGRSTHAAIAHSYAMQGLPARQYGEAIAARYREMADPQGGQAAQSSH